MTSVGITGPAKGLTIEQERFVADTVLSFLLDYPGEVDEFVSGAADCVDSIGVTAAIRARVPAFRLTNPRMLKRNVPEDLRSNLDQLIQEVQEAERRLVVENGKPGPNSSKGYLNRNDLTIARIGVLLAFPPTSVELKGQGPGAGTWATIRRARRAGRVIWFYPLDGSRPWREHLIR